MKTSTERMPRPEARSGLAPWTRAELPEPPDPRGFEWVRVVGPGVIILGLSIGSGEFLLGPAVFVRYGLALLWVTAVAIALQAVFNLEVMRYTLATGEPVYRHVAIPPDEPPPAPPVQQPTDDELELDREMEYLAEPEEALHRGVDLGE